MDLTSSWVKNVDSCVMSAPQTTLRIYLAHPLAKLPFRASAEAAGFDLYTIEGGELYPGDTKTFSTGLIIQPPPGFHLKVWGRSGWGRKFGIGIPHGMGLIDRDYCGPEDIIQVVLHRTSSNGHRREAYQPLTISAGDRIAQMTIERTNILEFEVIKQPPSEATRGGFASTGIR